MGHISLNVCHTKRKVIMLLHNWMHNLSKHHQLLIFIWRFSFRLPFDDTYLQIKASFLFFFYFTLCLALFHCKCYTNRDARFRWAVCNVMDFYLCRLFEWIMLGNKLKMCKKATYQTEKQKRKKIIISSSIRSIKIIA